MKFGLFGSGSAKRGATVDSNHTYNDFVDYVIAAESYGYHAMYVVEHHFTGFGQVSATLNFLTWIGARTSTIRLGTAVLVLPWHNPVLLAEQAATLDLLSGGRVDFGVGRGYRHNEFAGFCVPMEAAEAMFNESLEVIRRSWTENERWSHHGEFWQFDDVVVEPPVLQKPHPPIWMGAGSPGSITKVAAHGANLLVDQFGSLDLTVERINLFRTEVEARGRTFDPYEVGVARGLYVARDAADRDAAIERRRTARSKIDNLAQRPDGQNKASIMSYDDTSEANLEAALFGTIDEIADKVGRLHDAGARYLLLTDGGSGLAGLRTFAEEVMPAFADDDEMPAAVRPAAE